MVTMEDTTASITGSTTAAIMDIITARSHQINHSRKLETLHQQARILAMLRKPVKRQAGSVGEVAARKKANVAGNNTGVRKKPSADEFDGDFRMDL